MGCCPAILCESSLAATSPQKNLCVGSRRPFCRPSSGSFRSCSEDAIPRCRGFNSPHPARGTGGTTDGTRDPRTGGGFLFFGGVVGRLCRAAVRTFQTFAKGRLSPKRPVYALIYRHCFRSMCMRSANWPTAATSAVANTIQAPTAATAMPPTSGRTKAGAASALKYPL